MMIANVYPGLTPLGSASFGPSGLVVGGMVCPARLCETECSDTFDD